MDYVDFLISACMRHLPFFHTERECGRLGITPPTMFIVSTDRCKAPPFKTPPPPKNSKQSPSQPTAPVNADLKRPSQIILPPRTWSPLDSEADDKITR